MVCQKAARHGERNRDLRVAYVAALGKSGDVLAVPFARRRNRTCAIVRPMTSSRRCPNSASQRSLTSITVRPAGADGHRVRLARTRSRQSFLRGAKPSLHVPRSWIAERSPSTRTDDQEKLDGNDVSAARAAHEGAAAVAVLDRPGRDHREGGARPAWTETHGGPEQDAGKDASARSGRPYPPGNRNENEDADGEQVQRRDHPLRRRPACG